MRSTIGMLVVTLGFLEAVASGAISPIGPFTGQFTETFNQFDNTVAAQSLPVFGGQGALQNLSAGGAIKVEFSSTFQGQQVLPLSDMMGGQLGVAQWVFDQPVTRFGGWWENNSGQPDANVSFFDAQNNLLGATIASVPFQAGPSWTWNGWQFDTPVSRIVVSGNGTVNGFLWYENMQVDFAVPGPGAALMLIVGCISARPRRR